VADRIAKARLLAAKFTYHCHCCIAPDRKISNPLKIHATRDCSGREAICLNDRRAKAALMATKSGCHPAKIGWKIGVERDKVYATNSDAYDSHEHGELTGAQQVAEQ
jgi:hypothetical protein